MYVVRYICRMSVLSPMWEVRIKALVTKSPNKVGFLSIG